MAHPLSTTRPDEAQSQAHDLLEPANQDLGRLRPRGAPASLVRAALLTRLERVVGRLCDSISEEDAAGALSAATDLDVLAATLQRATLHVDPIDPETAAAYARGRSAREQLLNAEGGMATVLELGQELGGISRQAVDKRRKFGRLFAVQERGDWLYPRWQVRDGQALPGLEVVLEELAAREQGPWEMLIFFLNTSADRQAETVLETLRAGRIDAVLAAARAYATQGAR